MDVTVVIASYGAAEYRELALKRAAPSVEGQNAETILVHQDTGTLAEVRNAGLAHVKTEWVCFLDADDELEPGYLDHLREGTADLRAPSVRYVNWGTKHGRVIMPRVVGHRHRQCEGDCLDQGNWMAIGTLARTELVCAAGGFAEYPVYEDWGLWAKMWRAGATVEAIPQAVYRAHARPNSRNRGSLTQHAKHAVHQQIARDLGLTVPA